MRNKTFSITWVYYTTQVRLHEKLQCWETTAAFPNFSQLCSKSRAQFEAPNEKHLDTHTHSLSPMNKK